MARNEMNDGEIQVTEGALAQLFSAPEPDAKFVDALRLQLLAEARPVAADLVTSPAAPALPSPDGGLWTRFTTWWGSSFRRHGWATAALALVLALGLVTALAGPARVLAELGRIRAYLFGVGFVDLEHTRALPAPVSVTRDGVTLTVSQVLAQPDRTVVTLRAEGLPPLADETQAPDELSFHLRLPDGSTLAPTGWQARRGEATVDFPPLPADVYRVDLLLERLPITLPGAAPENWEVTLGLHPATGEMMPTGYAVPYTLEDASDSHQGITLRVLEAAHSRESTGLNLELAWPEADWRFPRLAQEGRVSLRDDLGHVYYEGFRPSAASLAAAGGSVAAVTSREMGSVTSPTPEPAPGREVRALAFAPVSPAATRLTLTVDSLTFSVPVDARFTLDLGDDPHLGQEWPLDVVVEVDGLPLQITSARLEANEYEGENEPPFALVLHTAPLPSSDERSLGYVSFSALTGDYRGTRGHQDPRTRLSEYSLLLATQPSGTVTIQVGGTGYGADVTVRGPWVIAWDIPGGPAVPMAPVSLQPGAEQEGHGLTLRLEQVTATDRLTAVTLGLEPGPEGETLVRALAGLPGSDQATPYFLSDERGNHYETGVTLGWEPSGRAEFDSRRLFFAPLLPLAERVTIHVPAVLVERSAPLTFTVAVPEGVSEGDEWAVDVPLDLGGCRLHFTQARLQNDLLVLSAGLAEPVGPGERRLAGVALSSVTGPDGVERPLAVGSPLVGQFSQTVTIPGAGQRLLVGLGSGDGGGPLGPGTYTVEVAGVQEAVPGPWELSWEMP